LPLRTKVAFFLLFPTLCLPWQTSKAKALQSGCTL